MTIDEGYLKDFIKKYGKGVLRGGQDIVEKERSVVPVSPAIDLGIGGGIPEGSTVLLSGEKKCGKTTLALNICKNAQLLYPEKHIFYLDVENRMKTLNLQGIEGLDYSPERFTVISSSFERFISGEEFLEESITLIKSHPGCIIVMDSISQLCPSGDVDNPEIQALKRPTIHRALSDWSKKISGYINPSDSIFIGILHVHTNTSGYGKKYIIDSGVKIQYQGDVSLQATKYSDWMYKDNQIGQVVEWDVHFSALSGPGAKPTSYIKYGIGIDEVMEVINLALDFGLISKAGAWFNIEGMDVYEEGDEHFEKIQLIAEQQEKPVDKAFKFQGIDNLYAFIRENRFIANLLLNEIKVINEV